MVATRRMAQNGPDEDELAMDLDPSLALKKKPVRKATAKTTKTQAKPKTIRGKKSEPQPEQQESGPMEEDARPVEPAKPATRKTAGRAKKEAEPAVPVTEETIEVAKPTRSTKGSVRGRKTVTVAEDDAAPAAQPAEDPKPTRSTKAGSVRGEKAAVAVDQDAAPPAVEEPRPTRATKGGSVRGRKAATAVEEAHALPAPEPKPTRQTRTTATKAAPLSPKKITQVSKTATRATRVAIQKPPAKVASTKAQPKGKGTSRKRTVSDENADVPDLAPVNEEVDEDVIMLSATPVKSKSTPSRATKQDAAVESEASMSSRPTTPNDSAAQSFNNVDEDNEDILDNDTISEAEGSVKADCDGSDDELCGPKTPMKRSSPGAEARYLSSVQRTIRKYDEENRIQTPARRFALLGSQRGTPQTQKPYCKPSAPTSEVRPMTVARGTNRAFVFKDLRDGVPGLEKDEPEFSEHDELSFIPDEDIIPVDDDVETVHTPTAAASDPAPPQLQSPPESDVDMVDHETMAAAVTYPVEGEGFVNPSLVEQDPDETVLMDDAENTEASLAMQPGESFETKDTVLINHPEQAESDQEMVDDETEGEEDSVIITESNEMKTDVADTTPIAVNFDDHLTAAHSSPEEQHIESYADATVVSASQQDEEDAVAGAEMDFEIELATPEEQHSRRQTIDFNDFIDVAALSEPTAMLDVLQIENRDELVDEKETEPTSEANSSPQPVLKDTDATSEESATNEAERPQAQLSPQQENPAVQSEDSFEHKVPHYALPTIAFDARRKSLPAYSHHTPVKIRTRPNTSDGASMPRIANPFANAWWARSRAGSTATTPIRPRPSTAHGETIAGISNTPAKSPSAKTPVATPKERFSRLAPRTDYQEHAKTVTAPVRFQTPSEKSPKRGETVHNAIPGQVKADVVPTGPPAPSPVATPQATPQERYPLRTPQQVNAEQTTPRERYPRLGAGQDYEEHAKTVAGPVRFQTPEKKSLKRPATTQKPESLRKAALKANTPMASHSPVKTPLKGPAMTPSQAPMTPHPAAPLRGVVALVEIFTNEGESASQPFNLLLHRLGAKTTKLWSNRVTHVIFKDGSPTTLQRVRLNNKEYEEKDSGTYVHCINSRWISDCDTEGTRMDESDEAYLVDVAEVPRGGKRRRKSMEPSALMNIGGNIVRDRKSSLGRVSSLGRSPLKFDSPAKKPEPVIQGTPEVPMVDKENSEDELGSPATPAWIAAPGQLVQQTAPMNRVRKLELPGKAAKNRRLTFWNGGA